MSPISDVEKRVKEIRRKTDLPPLIGPHDKLVIEVSVNT